jgi:bacteriorhodopsin
MSRSFSSFVAQTLVTLAVLIVCIPIILVSALIGVCGSGGANNLFHNDYAWLWFAVSAAVFIFMIWLLVKLSSVWKDQSDIRQSSRY